METHTNVAVKRVSRAMSAKSPPVPSTHVKMMARVTSSADHMSASVWMALQEQRANSLLVCRILVEITELALLLETTEITTAIASKGLQERTASSHRARRTHVKITGLALSAEILTSANA